MEGYGKGLTPDDLMRARMEVLRREREELQHRAATLERQLTRLEMTEEQEAQALAFAERVCKGLQLLDFHGRRQLLRLLLEDVTCYEDRAVVHTILPAGPPEEKVQLCPPHRADGPG